MGRYLGHVEVWVAEVRAKDCELPAKLLMVGPQHRPVDLQRLVPRLAVGENVILLHLPLPILGVSIVMERGCQQNDSLADGYPRRRRTRPASKLVELLGALLVSMLHPLERRGRPVRSPAAWTLAARDIIGTAQPYRGGVSYILTWPEHVRRLQKRTPDGLGHSSAPFEVDRGQLLEFGRGLHPQL